MSKQQQQPPVVATTMMMKPTKQVLVNHTTPTKNHPPRPADWSVGTGYLPGREVVGPLFLIAVTPPFSMIFCHVCTVWQGDFTKFARHVWYQATHHHHHHPVSLWHQLVQLWPNPWNGDVWRMIGTFFALQMLLMKIIPGRAFQSTMTPQGHIPTYKANGTASYMTTMVLFMTLDYCGWFDLATIYDHFGEILSTMNVIALLFCTFLTIKGYVAPSYVDAGTTGNVINDFYWGMELYPQLFYYWDVKQLTNCRAGMMFWPLAVLSFLYKNADLHDGVVQNGLAVSVALQLVYCTKFFHWEMGYMCSMDIQHDRAGYYICWGCLVWVPAVYTSAAFYLTGSGPPVSTPLALGIFLVGLTCIYINYDSDRQRYVFRQSHGKCTIWGRSPPRHIVATYKVASGHERTSLLLVDGWWKISRHFHYVPEILAAFCWSVPALNSGLLGPYFYVIFLTILLTDRAFRDDSRCRAKYGKYWDEYCDQVPYKIVPGIV